MKQSEIVVESYEQQTLIGQPDSYLCRITYTPTRESVVASGQSEFDARYNALRKATVTFGPMERCECCDEERLDKIIGEPCACAYELCPGRCYELGLR